MIEKQRIVFSVVIPIYNRPEELSLLLNSIRSQYLDNIELIIVEDGSASSSEHIVDAFKTSLNISYITQENKGPAEARNTGAGYAKGEWLIFFDSDCELPPDWFKTVSREISNQPEMALFGGPDQAMSDFTSFQKGINYAMTSILTTGGIRGSKKKMDMFYPRTFNMGVKRSVFNAVGGFSNLRFGEDLDFSMNVIEKGFECRLLTNAWVYHRRRTSIKAFYKQVFNSGMARLVLEELHPGTLRLVHTLPTFFSVFVLFSMIFSFYNPICIVPVAFIALLWFVHALFQTSSVRTSFWAAICSFVQLVGYGTGFLWAWTLKVTGTKSLSNQYAFRKTFYEK